METLEDLRNALDRTKGKVKFCVKLLRALKFTLAHPDLAPSVGVTWCRDGIHFVCNAQIFGTILDLNANSINTNMRMYGFAIDEQPTFCIEREFNGFPDIKAWKLRWNSSCEFNTNTTEEEADKIPAKEKPRSRLELVQKPVIYDDVLPEPLVELIGEREPLKNEILALMSRVAATKEWKCEFLQQARAQWLECADTIDPISPAVLVREILERANPAIPDSDVPLVEVNLGYILHLNNNMSQVEEGVSFVDFLKLSLRFGLLDQIANSIYAVSDRVMEEANWGWFDSQNFWTSFSQSQRDVQPCFASWFCPSSDQHTATKTLSSGLEWVVRMSTTANLFTIQRQLNNSIIATHIRFDAIARPQNRYTVEFESGEKSSATWSELITEVLGLQFPSAKPVPLAREPPKFVDGSAIATA